MKRSGCDSTNNIGSRMLAIDITNCQRQLEEAKARHSQQEQNLSIPSWLLEDLIRTLKFADAHMGNEILPIEIKRCQKCAEDFQKTLD